MKKGAGIALLLGAGALVAFTSKSNATPPIYVPPTTGGGGNTGGVGTQIQDTAKRAVLIAWAYAKWDSTSATDFVQFLALLTASEIGVLYNYVILKFRDATTIAGMNALDVKYDLAGLYP